MVRSYPSVTDVSVELKLEKIRILQLHVFVLNGCSERLLAS
jgi:hypothetical protein